MPALRILLLARNSRWAMVFSGTRNACAISAVVSPASVRSVSATCASRCSAGWQQVKISWSRSSGMASDSSNGSGIGCAIVATSRSFVASFAARRNRSSARLRAVSWSQAPGRGGTPSRRQRSRAWAKASWAHSSARSQSPVSRISAATIRPHSSV